MKWSAYRGNCENSRGGAERTVAVGRDHRQIINSISCDENVCCQKQNKKENKNKKWHMGTQIRDWTLKSNSINWIQHVSRVKSNVVKKNWREKESLFHLVLLKEFKVVEEDRFKKRQNERVLCEWTKQKVWKWSRVIAVSIEGGDTNFKSIELTLLYYIAFVRNKCCCCWSPFSYNQSSPLRAHMTSSKRFVFVLFELLLLLIFLSLSLFLSYF